MAILSDLWRNFAIFSLVAATGCGFPEFDPASPDSPLTMTSVSGNSPLPSTDGPSVFRDGLIVRGEGLADGLEAELRGVDGAPDFAELTIRSASGGEAEVVLPAAIVEGTYTLVLRRGALSATRKVRLLRGAKGPPGQLDLSPYATWAELGGKLPDPATLLDEAEALATYALAEDLPDLATFAKKSALSGLVPLDDALAGYAHRTDLIDPKGYPTKETLLATYAQPSDLPDLSLAIEKTALPDLSKYITLADAKQQAVSKSQVEGVLSTKDEMDAAWLAKNGDLSDAQKAQIAALVTDALFDQPCPDGSVPVGATCVDIYEATVREEPCGEGGKAHGANADDYGATLPDSGASGTWFACADEGVAPSRHITWFQAARTCAASGRRLCDQAEWQAAMAGTPDTPLMMCGLSGISPFPGQLDSGCVSNHGVIDGVGSLAEWTSSWDMGGPSWMSTTSQTVKLWPMGFGDGADAVENWNGGVLVGPGDTWAAGMPAAVVRGGSYASKESGGVFAIDMTRAPYSGAADVGFRCCRSR